MNRPFESEVSTLQLGGTAAYTRLCMRYKARGPSLTCKCLYVTAGWPIGESLKTLNCILDVLGGFMFVCDYKLHLLLGLVT
jgi:hypothetical protein